jgi:hypothetical protein
MGGTGGRDFIYFRGQIRSSEAAMGGEGGRAAPRLGVAISDGCTKSTGAHAGPKPTSNK